VIVVAARLLLVCAGCWAASACTEYSKRIDAVTDSGGNAIAHNSAIHIGTPWPRHAYDRRIDLAGDRAVAAIERYRTGQRSGETSSPIIVPAPVAPAPAPAQR
jgi:hypothetical protein